MAYVQLNHDFIKFIDPQLYAGVLEKKDDGDCILRLQLICERFLSVYLKERIAPENIEFFTSGKGKGSEILRHFNERLTASVASGLPAELARPLKHLNKIRNEFAHNLDYEIKGVDMSKYFELVDEFKVDVGVPHGFEGPIKDLEVHSDGKVTKAKDSFQAGFTAATYALMTKAGIWLANDLNKRGKLNLGGPLQ
ncbi:hypothetical protein [Pseudomonas sp. URMO17WK12:I11]|uniref:hypothetical protein n=1 Tax=Pseudomonas sp. URMO17WK12:I11 TaxID=1283291 RepID=UPI0011A55455|nr:hypothetical protein [Pseudomonas sp. URMO17WK12:I11]